MGGGSETIQGEISIDCSMTLQDLTIKQKRQFLQNLVSGGNGEINGEIRECTDEEKQSKGNPQFVVYWEKSLYYVDSYEHAEIIRSMLDGTHGLDI